MASPQLTWLLPLLSFTLVVLAQHNVSLELSDPSIKYSGNWTDPGETQVIGSSLSFNFTGTAIYVLMPRFFSYGDGTFLLDGVESSWDGFAEDLEFGICGLCETGLSPIQHSVKLTLSSHGHSQAPESLLLVSQIIYTAPDVSSPPADTTPGSITHGSSQPPNPTQPNNSSPSGAGSSSPSGGGGKTAIIGAIVAVIVVLVCAAIAVMYYRKRRGATSTFRPAQGLPQGFAPTAGPPMTFNQYPPPPPNPPSFAPGYPYSAPAAFSSAATLHSTQSVYPESLTGHSAVSHASAQPFVHPPPVPPIPAPAVTTSSQQPSHNAPLSPTSTFSSNSEKRPLMMMSADSAGMSASSANPPHPLMPSVSPYPPPSIQSQHQVHLTPNPAPNSGTGMSAEEVVMLRDRVRNLEHMLEDRTAPPPAYE